MADASKPVRKIDARGEDPVMPSVFAVIGENRDDPDRLLLLGEDGQHYQYEIVAGTTTPVIPDESWIVDQRLEADWTLTDI